MTTLIKFTFINGLELFTASLLLAFIALYVFYCIQQKQEQRKYNKAYENLKFLVERSIVNAPTKKALKEKFDEINKFSCKNYEKLQFLEQAFYQKFKK